MPIVKLNTYETTAKVYKDYVRSYAEDLKLIYRINSWPCAGVNHFDDEPEEPVKTLPEKLFEERSLLRPYGGRLGLEWPKYKDRNLSVFDSGTR